MNRFVILSLSVGIVAAVDDSEADCSVRGDVAETPSYGDRTRDECMCGARWKKNSGSRNGVMLCCKPNGKYEDHDRYTVNFTGCFCAMDFFYNSKQLVHTIKVRDEWKQQLEDKKVLWDQNLEAIADVRKTRSLFSEVDNEMSNLVDSKQWGVHYVVSPFMENLLRFSLNDTCNNGEGHGKDCDSVETCDYEEEKDTCEMETFTVKAEYENAWNVVSDYLKHKLDEVEKDEKMHLGRIQHNTDEAKRWAKKVEESLSCYISNHKNDEQGNQNYKDMKRWMIFLNSMWYQVSSNNNHLEKDTATFTHTLQHMINKIDVDIADHAESASKHPLATGKKV